MKSFSTALSAHLAGGATTLCHCWTVTTRAGEVLGFTDHDRDLDFKGIVHEAQAGFTASEMQQGLGFAVDNLDAAGALQSARLSETRIAAGDFDHAAVDLWRVNWQEPEQAWLLHAGHIGEIARGGLGFTAEVRGLMALLDQPQGRLFQFGCDATLGDSRCGVALTDPELRATGVVVASEDNRRLKVSGLGGQTDGWFDRGRLAWTTGRNAGRAADVKRQRTETGAAMVELWEPAPEPVTTGDAFTVTAGCDRQFATCCAKFGNGGNFRGFPHMPGDDFVLSYPAHEDAANTGASLAS